MPAAATQTELSLTVTQLVKAPPERVFDAFLDPALFCKWVGPRTWVERCDAVALEPRVGGRYELSTRLRDTRGREACNGTGVSGVYRAIDRHTRLAFTWLRNGDPGETLVTVTFAPDPQGTLVTLTHSGFVDTTARDQHRAGWAGSLPQLDDLLNLRLTLTQQVNAAPDRVFAALTDAALVCKWLGPRSSAACEVVALDARPGGRYRFRMRMHGSPDGKTAAQEKIILGTFTEVSPPARLAFTWGWEDQPGETRVTFTLRPHAGGTEVTLSQENLPNTDSLLGHRSGWIVSLLQLADAVAA